MIRIKEKYRRLAAVLLSTSLFIYIWINHLPTESDANIMTSLRLKMASNSGVHGVLVSHDDVNVSRVQQFEEKGHDAHGAGMPIRETLNISIKINPAKPLLTLFTTWAEEKDRYPLHNLTVRNWQSLEPYVIPVVFTNQHTVAEECRQKGWDVLPIKISANGGIPVLKFMFLDVISTYNTPFYGFGNSDILFTDSLIETLAWINVSVNLDKPVLIIGKRTNINYVGAKETETWKKLSAVASSRGKLFRGLAEDYFITSRFYPWKKIPEVVIGRPAFDNWLVYHTRKQNQTLIDATRTILAVHQTTKAGNIEGQGRPNSSYNRNLLKRLYKDVNFSAGFVDCANLSTKYEKDSVIIVKRKVPTYCRLFRRQS